MELSLAAKAFLLACNPGSGRLWDPQRTAYLVHGAGLTDLLLRERLGDEGGRVTALPGDATGDAVLDEMLGAIIADGPRSWKHRVRKGSRHTLGSVEDQLDGAGIIRVQRQRLLGVIPSHRVAVVDTGMRANLVATVDRALRGEVGVDQIPAVDAALTALVAAVHLGKVIPMRERLTYRGRLKELEERGGAAVPALRRVFRQLQGARTAAISSGGGG